LTEERDIIGAIKLLNGIDCPIFAYGKNKLWYYLSLIID